MNEESRITELEEKIDYHFQNRELIREALTHSSYANERKIRKIECNERLEFLGDAILEQQTSIFLFRQYAKMPEGQLSKLRAALVCETALARVAEKLGLGALLFLGKGEDAQGGRKKPSLTSDAVEALIGALYLDGGEEAAHAFIMRYVLVDVKEKEKESMDYKSRLQELIQAENHGTISYRVTGEYGPEHEKVFEVELAVNQKVISTGRGKNKKAAEQAAAHAALEQLKTTDGE